MPDLKRNPSRKTCEEAIRRILMTEVLEQGRNLHFKTAMDFMGYFESLYPPSPSLIKQVQRAIRSMDLPKDEDGFFIVNKTKSQLAHDAEITSLLHKSAAKITPLKEYETLFLELSPEYKGYLLQLIDESPTLRGKYITILDTTEGFIFYTYNRNALSTMLGSLLGEYEEEEQIKEPDVAD